MILQSKDTKIATQKTKDSNTKWEIAREILKTTENLRVLDKVIDNE